MVRLRHCHCRDASGDGRSLQERLRGGPGAQRRRAPHGLRDVTEEMARRDLRRGQERVEQPAAPPRPQPQR
jgi:hypothetical protein